MSKPRVSDERLNNLLYCAKNWEPSGLALLSTNEQKMQNDCILNLSRDLLDARRDLAASEQRCRELEADAERYRVIKAHRWELFYGLTAQRAIVFDYANSQQVAVSTKPYDIDAAIDAAIAAQRQKVGE